MRLSNHLFVLLLVWCLCTGCDRSNVPAIKKWTTFSPAGERFSVLMPIQPTPSTVMTRTQAGQFPVYLYTARPSKDYAFLVTHNSFPPQADLSQVFDKTEAQNINNGAQLISKRDIALHGTPGRELVFEKQGRVVSLRFYLIGRDIYQVFCVMPKGSAHQQLVNEFLDSFHFK